MSRIAMAWSVSLIASVVGCACEPPPRAADHGASWPRGSVAARPATRGIQTYYQEQRQKLEAFEAPTDDVRAALMNNLAIVALRMETWPAPVRRCASSRHWCRRLMPQP